MKNTWKTLLVAGSLASLALGATAQMGPAPDDHAAGLGMHQGHMMSPEHMEARLNKHLTELKAKLHITAAQEPVWTAFSVAMKPPVSALSAPPKHVDMEKLTTPERIDAMRQMRAQHEEVMKPYMDKRDEAIKALYAALDAQQKKTLDAEHAHMVRRGPWHG
jgi:hypothetical protein